MNLRNILIVLLLCGSVFVVLAQKKKKDKQQPAGSTAATINYKEVGAPLPPLKVYTREGKYLTEADIAGNGHLIVMLFNPTCDHCEEQTVLFREHISLFKKTKLVLLAAANMVPHLGYFTNVTKTADYPAIQIGVDSSGYIDKTFRQVTLPQINVYDKDRKLTKMFFGSTPLDSLRQYLD